jgi:hypothetical protein
MGAFSIDIGAKFGIGGEIGISCCSHVSVSAGVGIGFGLRGKVSGETPSRSGVNTSYQPPCVGRCTTYSAPSFRRSRGFSKSHGYGFGFGIGEDVGLFDITP